MARASNDAAHCPGDPQPSVRIEWPEFNEGMVFVDKTQGAPKVSLLELYARKHPDTATHSGWQQKIAAGLIRINGATCTDAHATVPPSAVLEYCRPPWAEPPAPSVLRVLWHDDHLVAVDKPSGLQVLPGGPFHQRCALTLLARLHEAHPRQFAALPTPVHRLGRGTSGVLLCGCSEAARRALSRAFEEHSSMAASGHMRKVYRALVSGLVELDEGEVAVPIGRLQYPGVRGGLHAADPIGGRPARSAYTVVLRDPGAGSTLVDVEIFSGRPHQIRIHMAALGHPLVGDPLYCAGGVPAPAPCGVSGGGGPSEDARRPLPGDCGSYLLHSMVLELQHPVTGQRVSVTSPPPPGLRAEGDP